METKCTCVICNLSVLCFFKVIKRYQNIFKTQVQIKNKHTNDSNYKYKELWDCTCLLACYSATALIATISGEFSAPSNLIGIFTFLGLSSYLRNLSETQSSNVIIPPSRPVILVGCCWRKEMASLEQAHLCLETVIGYGEHTILPGLLFWMADVQDWAGGCRWETEQQCQNFAQVQPHTAN